MAALPYIQLYVADYLADTRHLTLEEHGAYLLLIMNYWQTGHALIDSDKRLASVCSTSVEIWLNIRPAIEEFFDIKDGIWTHQRIEKDLAKVASKSKKASLAGKKSAEKRAVIVGDFNERSTNVGKTLQQNGNHTDTDTDTDTDTEKTTTLAGSVKKDQPSSSPKKTGKKKNELSDSDWLLSLQGNKAFAALNIENEYAKCQAWCGVNNRQPTRRMFVNWLNRAEKPMNVKGVQNGSNRADTRKGNTGFAEARKSGETNWLE